MKKGFLTLAVGDKKYFQLAANLLQSYKYHTKLPYRFAIVTDQQNSYTDLFDDVILISDAEKSYMDKLKLLELAPYDQNIFIDADCLAYGDLNDFWTCFPQSGTSCFGKALSLDSTEGWFLIDDIGEYSDKVEFIPQMHGGIIFINKDLLTRDIYKTALKIAIEYNKFKFKYFDKPADEPIMALSMALNHCKPIELPQSVHDCMFLFYPIAKKVKENMLKGECSYSLDGISWINNVRLLHWQNVYTETVEYKCAVTFLKKQTKFCCNVKLFFLKLFFSISYFLTNKCLYYLKRIVDKIQYDEKL